MRVREHGAARRERVHVRCDRLAVAHRADPVAEIVDREEYHIGSIHREPWLGEQEKRGDEERRA